MTFLDDHNNLSDTQAPRTGGDAPGAQAESVSAHGGAVSGDTAGPIENMPDSTFSDDAAELEQQLLAAADMIVLALQALDEAEPPAEPVYDAADFGALPEALHTAHNDDDHLAEWGEWAEQAETAEWAETAELAEPAETLVSEAADGAEPAAIVAEAAEHTELAEHAEQGECAEQAETARQAEPATRVLRAVSARQLATLGALARLAQRGQPADPAAATQVAERLVPSAGHDDTLYRRARAARRWRILFAVLIPVFALVLVFSLWQIFSIQSERQAAIDEYDSLREEMFPATSAATPAIAPSASQAASSQASSVSQEEPEPMMTFEQVVARNAECVAWIEIPDTPLSYPVVRGPDNEKYLNTTFLGNHNAAGAIFMDFRNAADLSSPHTVIYGHNLKNGTMFGSLHRYMDPVYLSGHRTITLYTGSATYTYSVVYAAVVNMYDDIYNINFADTDAMAAFAERYGAPTGTPLLTLSTCTNNSNEERMVVLAALVGVS